MVLNQSSCARRDRFLGVLFKEPRTTYVPLKLNYWSLMRSVGVVKLVYQLRKASLDFVMVRVELL